MQIAWAARMRASFGAPFLWLVTLVYFTQGFRSFVWTAVSYQMKDILKLSPSASQVVVSVAHSPWSIKPIYGILSDCIPINGRRRLPYLVIATILSLFPWLLLGLKTSIRSSRTSFTASLTLQNLGSAMADVVIDAMIAEAVRAEHAEFAGDLQSLSWFAMALGGICGSLLGGYTLSQLSIDTIFLLFAVLPAVQLLSCSLVKETPSEPQRVQIDIRQENMELKEDISHFSSNSSFSKTSNRSKRKSKHKNDKRKRNLKSGILEKHHGSLVKRYYMSLKSAIYSLVRTFKQPIILRPMAWFFFSNITVPSLSTVMFYYQTEVLNLEASFLGNARVVGWLGLMLGTYAYNRYLKHKKLREVLTYAHIGLAIANLFDIILVSKLHSWLAIPDKFMVLWGSAFGDTIRQFKLMPFLIISGRLCPPGIEGTLFALFMSINNLSSNLGSVFGAALASALNISSESFHNLIFGIDIQLLATLLPITFLFLIPKEATGLAS
ncbi:putative folate-biopterin transporter 4 isoform X2 [Canna indica]|uniref:Folate-biopterin transporter 4 isoform X2 n=1 Tax=Canna indica TaxID=4628 RepID=A0AAQ3QF64_9LILI|nr:putative folate-biopterin transporter 4 isoform X2 [Canna indica]